MSACGLGQNGADLPDRLPSSPEGEREGRPRLEAVALDVDNPGFVSSRWRPSPGRRRS